MCVLCCSDVGNPIALYKRDWQWPLNVDSGHMQSGRQGRFPVVRLMNILITLCLAGKKHQLLTALINQSLTQNTLGRSLVHGYKRLTS
jgi:hypothetical protein